MEASVPNLTLTPHSKKVLGLSVLMGFLRALQVPLAPYDYYKPNCSVLTPNLFLALTVSIAHPKSQSTCALSMVTIPKIKLQNYF